MLENLARFITLIGALVFVHEFGHFVLAKLLGVKVLKFSLGFGARVVGFRHHDTEYCISLIPLGGYVKLLGEHPGDPVPPEDLPQSFHRQTLWKRFAIVLAGPAMSLVFPTVLYTLVFLGQTTLAPPVIGTVVPGYPAEGELLPGDRVTAMDGAVISSFQGIRERVAASPGRPIRFDILRDGHPMTVTVTPEAARVERPLDIVNTVGVAGITATYPLPVVGVREPATPASVAGLRTFDMVTMYAGRPIRRWSDLERVLGLSHGATVPVGFLRPREVSSALGGLADLEVFDPGLAQVTPEPGVGDMTRRTGIESPDLYVSDVRPGSAEYRMGLRRGDRIVSLDAVAPPSWERFYERIVQGAERLRSLRFVHDNHASEGAFALRPAVWSDEFGQRCERLEFTTGHWVPSAPETPIANPAPLRYAISHAEAETMEALTFLSTGLVRLVEGRVPISTVGGPIMIYDASRSTGQDGVGGFLWLMALVSLNLGLLNLLPIPTLDGGHLLFFTVEGILRRPVPRWVRQVASAMGMAVLVGIMLLAFRNDLQRKFGPTPPSDPGISAAP